MAKITDVMITLTEPSEAKAPNATGTLGACGNALWPPLRTTVAGGEKEGK